MYIQFVLSDYPPSTNAIWRSVRGRVIKSNDYRKWLDNQTLLINLQKGQVTGRYQLTITAQRKDNRRRDIDNLIKPLHDLLVRAGKVEDDSLCQRVTAQWDESKGQQIKLELRSWET